MIAVKGKYDGMMVTLERTPEIPECEVIVTFLDHLLSDKTDDDDSLAYLFKGFTDDGIREPIIDFG